MVVGNLCGGWRRENVWIVSDLTYSTVCGWIFVVMGLGSFERRVENRD